MQDKAPKNIVSSPQYNTQLHLVDIKIIITLLVLYFTYSPSKCAITYTYNVQHLSDRNTYMSYWTSLSDSHLHEVHIHIVKNLLVSIIVHVVVAK